MNFDNLDNKENLQTIILDKPLFNNYITDTKGYIFYFLKKHDIYPDLNILLDNSEINIYSLDFIINNYSLSEKEVNLLRPYFDSYADNIISQSPFSEDDFLDYLKNNKRLPLTSTVSANFINKYITDFITYINNNPDYILDDLNEIFYNNFTKFSPQELISLPSEIKSKFFKKVYSVNYSHFDNNNFKKDFLNTYIENQDTFKEPITSIFNNYKLNKNERDTLLFLLNKDKENNHIQNYNVYAYAIEGFKELITPYEFLTTINATSFESLTLIEAQKYKSEIQKILLKHSEKNSDFTFLSYTGLKMKDEVFRELLDLDFFNKFLSLYPQNQVEKFTHHDMDRKHHIYSLIFKHINSGSLDMYQYFNLPKILKGMSFDNYDINNETLSYIIGHYIKTENFVKINGKLLETIYPFMANKELSEILEIFNNSISVNLLYSAYNFYSSEMIENYDIEIEKVEQLIEKISKQLHPEDVLPLEYLLNQPLKTDINNDKNKNYNFLMEDKEFNFFHSVSRIIARDDIRDNILKNEIILNDEILTILINEISNNSIYDFLTIYTEKHRDLLLKNDEFIRLVMNHTVLQEIFPLQNNENTQENNYKKLKESFYSSNKNYKEIAKTLSPDYLLTFSEIFLKEDNIYEYTQLIEMSLIIGSNNLETYRENLIEYLNSLTYEKTLKFIEQENFLHIYHNFFSLNRARNENYIFNPEFSNEQNISIFKTLEQHNNKLSNKDKISEYEFLFYFSKPNYQYLFKNIISQNNPSDIIYNPVYTFTKSIYLRDIIIPNYSAEEFYNLFLNIENSSDIFYTQKNSNCKFSEFIGDNFKNNESEFLKLVDMAKNKNLKLYCLLSVFPNYKNFVKNHYNEIEEHVYLKEKFDLDKVIDGFEIILDESVSKIKKLNLSNNEQKIFLKESNNFIHLFIKNTYCNSLNNDNHYSAYTEEQSNKIIDTLLKKSPSILYEYNNLGVYENLPLHISNKISQNLDFLDFFLNNQIPLNSFIDSPKIINLIHNIVDNLIEKEDTIKINYISHIFSQQSFLCDNVESGYLNHYAYQMVKIIKKNDESDYNVEKKMTAFLNKINLEKELEKFIQKNPKKLKKI